MLRLIHVGCVFECPKPDLRRLIAVLLLSWTLIAACLGLRVQTIPNPILEANSFIVFPGLIGGNRRTINRWTAKGSLSALMNIASNESARKPSRINISGIGLVPLRAFSSALIGG